MRDGIAARLTRWERGQALGWVFDNEDDQKSDSRRWFWVTT